jgi:hypothetical protein
MRWLAVVLAVAAFEARADELPPNACTGSLRAGEACAMDDGTPGVCVEEHHDYVDADGVKQRFTELLCLPAVTAAQRRLLPWLGFGLAFLALCLGLYSRPRANPPRGGGADQRGLGAS